MQNQTFKTPTKISSNDHSSIKLLKNVSTIKSLNEILKGFSKYISEIISEISPENQEKINTYFNKIFQLLKIISSEKKNLISKYDSILKLSETKIRVLYSDLFNLKIKNTFLENNIDILLKKESEYRLVKEKTGILVENGVVIHNDRKENEIFILRTENSNLKNVIKQKDKEIKEINNNFNNKQEIYDKKISQLNIKIEKLRYKLNYKNNKTKGDSCSSFNFNTNNEVNNSINNINNNKLNFTINNCINKDNINKITINGITNNNNNNNEYESCFNRNVNNNMNLIKRKYDSILFNKKKNIGKILRNKESQYISSLIHCQSMGYLNLKNKNNIKAKLKYKSTDKIFNLSKNKNNNSIKNLNLSNLNVSPIQTKKMLYFTPLNDELVNKLNYEPLNKQGNKHNSKSKQKSKKAKIKNNNNINTVNSLINNNNSNKSLIKSNNTSSMNGLKVIYNSKTKFKHINKKSDIQNKNKKLSKDINLSHNTSMNSSRIPVSNNNMSRSKISKKRSYSKNLGEEKDIEANNKSKKRCLIMNISGKENVLVNKTSMSSIKRKNTVSTSNNSFYNKNIFNL